MIQTLKFTAIILATFIMMFLTSLLLDLKIVQAQVVREVLVYFFMLLQLAIGFMAVQAVAINTPAK